MAMTMKIATVTVKGASPYSQSKRHTTPYNDGENHNDYEVRTWKERMHYHPEKSPEAGQIFIPPNQFHQALIGAAKFTGMQIPSKGKSTYTKHFEAGLLMPTGITLPDLIEDIDSEWRFVPSDGQKGGGKRVDKCFGIIHKWEDSITVNILDQVLMQTVNVPDLGDITVFHHHFMQAGYFVGIGRFRPAVGGYYGRFDVLDVTYTDPPKPKVKEAKAK